MALARVQATPSQHGDGSSVGLVFASPPAVGNAIVVGVLSYGQDATGCTDNYGNTYSLAVSRFGVTPRLAVYYCSKVTTSGASFTVTPTWGSTDYLAIAIEISGVGSGLVVDKTASNTGGGTTPSTGTTAALTANNVLLVALHAIANTQTSITVESVSPAWTEEAEFLPFSDVPGEIDTRILTSGLGTTASCSWTDTGFGSWNAAIVGFTATVTDARVSQVVAETLSLPTVEGRATQVVAETLTSTTLTSVVDAHVSQLVAETLSLPTVDGRVTQLVAELLYVGPPETRTTQLVVETISPIPPSPIRVSQVPLEVLDQVLSPARLSQAPVETVIQWGAPLVYARLSQAPIEIIYPFGCYATPEVRSVCPASLPLDALEED